MIVVSNSGAMLAHVKINVGVHVSNCTTILTQTTLTYIQHRHFIQTQLTPPTLAKTLEKTIFSYITNNIQYITTQHIYKVKQYHTHPKILGLSLNPKFTYNKHIDNTEGKT